MACALQLRVLCLECISDPRSADQGDGAQATKHLEHVGKLPMPERAQALAEIWACPAVDDRFAPMSEPERSQ
jgi:hypothetical protein